MATHKGNTGVIKVGVNAVAEVTSYSITETEGTAEDTALGDLARTYVADDLPTWTGSLNCWHDPSDTNGQAALLIGESVTLELGATGTATGREKLTGTAIITSRQVGDVSNGTIVPLAIQFQGTGALTHDTYA